MSTIANFHVPKVGDLFEEVNFTEIYGAAADKILRQYKDDAVGGPIDYSSKRPRYSGDYLGGGGGSGGGGGRGRYPPAPPRHSGSYGGGYG